MPIFISNLGNFFIMKILGWFRMSGWAWRRTKSIWG